MLFFRSEDAVRQWCSENGQPMRPVVGMEQLWSLAAAWYSNRLASDYRRPKPAEVVEMLKRLGFVEDFWDPTSESFS
ncbi:MAG: alkylmercury lyase family protein [Deltaproteobacteria bacterium]|nr:alkylmercury lyase family protein [Deltaproteobacteria bacterium]